MPRHHPYGILHAACKYGIYGILTTLVISINSLLQERGGCSKRSLVFVSAWYENKQSTAKAVRECF